jgi:release factor glutamine methyltransferase
MIYSPDEDSFLMQEVLEKTITNLLKRNPNLKVLEIGVGSGILLMTSSNLGVKNILGVDINSESVQYCKDLGLNVIKSNLFEKVREKFDIIFFNPPYLPEEKLEDKESKLITTGGKKGSEIINKFLLESKKHLAKDGKIFLLVSSLTNGINWRTFKKKIIAKKKIFFEELIVWELTQ